MSQLLNKLKYLKFSDNGSVVIKETKSRPKNGKNEPETQTEYFD